MKLYQSKQLTRINEMSKKYLEYKRFENATRWQLVRLLAAGIERGSNIQQPGLGRYYTGRRAFEASYFLVPCEMTLLLKTETPYGYSRLSINRTFNQGKLKNVRVIQKKWCYFICRFCFSIHTVYNLMKFNYRELKQRWPINLLKKS